MQALQLSIAASNIAGRIEATKNKIVGTAIRIITGVLTLHLSASLEILG